MPFPDDVGIVGIHGFEFNNKVGPYVVIAHSCWVYACLNRLLIGFVLPGDKQHVAIGHRLYVVVMALDFVGEFVFPDHLAVPGDFLDDAALATAPIRAGWIWIARRT